MKTCGIPLTKSCCIVIVFWRAAVSRVLSVMSRAVYSATLKLITSCH